MIVVIDTSPITALLQMYWRRSRISGISMRFSLVSGIVSGALRVFCHLDPRRRLEPKSVQRMAHGASRNRKGRVVQRSWCNDLEEGVPSSRKGLTCGAAG